MTSRTLADPIHTGFVVHTLDVAGTEILVKETVKRLNGRIVPTVFCLDEVGPLGHELSDAGVPVVSLNRLPGYDWRVAVRLARELRLRRIEVLHAHQYGPFFYAALARVLSGLRTSLVFTEHGRHYPDVVSTRRRLLNRFVLNRLTSAVTGVCRFSASCLAEREGFSAARIQVIENGIDLDAYRAPVVRDELQRSLGLDPERRYVVCVGRLHPVKDHTTLIRAFATLSERHRDVDLLVVGDGEMRAELEALTASLALQQRVLFMGVRSDVSRVLRAADLFVLCSLTEAASLTLLEAMAAGLPVIVTDVDGNPEIVRHGVDGLLVPPSDHQALGAAMMRVLDDRTQAAALAKAAEARVHTTYSLDRTVERYFSLYAHLARRPISH